MPKVSRVPPENNYGPLRGEPQRAVEFIDTQTVPICCARAKPTMQTIPIDSGKIKTVFNGEIVRLVIHYPTGAQTVAYDQDDHINGRLFLTELIKFGWVPGAIVARTMHLIHPAADYHEA